MKGIQPPGFFAPGRQLVVAAVMFLSVLAGMLPVAAVAAELQLRPGLAIEEGYDTNISFISTHALQDSYTTLSPNLLLERRTEQSDLVFEGRVDFNRYANKQRFDDTEQLYALRGEYRPSQLLRLGLEGRYRRDSSLDDELEETGLIYTRNDREILRVQPELSWWLSELYLVRLSGACQMALYDNPTYLDYNLWSSLLELGHAISSQNYLLVVDLGGSVADYANDLLYVYDDPRGYRLAVRPAGTVASYGLLAGFDLTPDPRWKLNFRWGVRQTAFEYDPFLAVTRPVRGIVFDERYRVQVGYVTLERLFERGGLSLDVRKNIVPSGRDSSIERVTARLTGDYALSERLRGELGGSYGTSQSKSDYLLTDQSSAAFNLGGSYRLWERVTAGVRYEYRRLRDHHNLATTRRHILSLRVSAYLDRAWQGR